VEESTTLPILGPSPLRAVSLDRGTPRWRQTAFRRGDPSRGRRLDQVSHAHQRSRRTSSGRLEWLPTQADDSDRSWRHLHKESPRETFHKRSAHCLVLKHLACQPLRLPSSRQPGRASLTRGASVCSRVSITFTCELIVFISTFGWRRIVSTFCCCWAQPRTGGEEADRDQMSVTNMASVC
jgi:hypothetical protein